MTANINDKLSYVAFGTKTEMASPGYTSGGSAMTGVDISQWPDDTAIYFGVDKIDSLGNRIANTYTAWKGVKSGSTIGSLVLKGGDDQDYQAGSTTRMFMLVQAAWANSLVDAMLTTHNQDGTLRDGAVNVHTQIASGTITATELAPAISPETLVNETMFDHVASGCVWTADSAETNRNASCTSGVVYINGKRLTIASVVARTFSALEDVYDDLHDNGDGTAVHFFTDRTNNDVSPSLASNSVRNAIVVVASSSIASASSINQGQEDRVLPISSGVAYTITDSLGNLIHPTDPTRRTLGYRQITSGFSLTASQTTKTQIPGLSCPVIIPDGRKAECVLFSGAFSAAGGVPVAYIWDGAVNVGSQLTQINGLAAGVQINGGTTKTLTAGAHVINGAINNTGTNNTTFDAATSQPAFIAVRLA